MTKSEKPVAKPDAGEGKSAAIEDDLELEVTLEPEPEAVVEVEPEPEPEPEPEDVPEPEPVAQDIGAVSAEGQSVNLSELVYRPIRRNSQSVAVLQSRLSALGYDVVRADLRGWFHDNTYNAVREWQEDNKLDVTGALSEDDAVLLFLGTEVVVNP